MRFFVSTEHSYYSCGYFWSCYWSRDFKTILHQQRVQCVKDIFWRAYFLQDFSSVDYFKYYNVVFLFFAKVSFFFFFQRSLTVTQSAVVCLHSFWLHFFCNDVLCMPCMDRKIQQYNKLGKHDDWFKKPIVFTTRCCWHTRPAALTRHVTAISIFQINFK